MDIEDIKKINKSELHLHLDGSLRLQTILDISNEIDIKFPVKKNINSLKEYISFKDNMSLKECLSKFEFTTAFMQREKDIKRITYELAEDVKNDGVDYVEIRFAPYLHTKKGLKVKKILRTVLDSAEKAESDFNITCRIIICSMRHEKPELSSEMAALAVEFKDNGVCGFDMAGGGLPIEPHKEAYRIAVDNNIGLTIHAGESEPPYNIKKAIEFYGARRIGHAASILDDYSALETVQKNNTGIEACLTSNIQTGAIGKISEHPLPVLLNHGITVCLNTDNMTLSNVSLSGEYHLAYKTFNLTDNDILKLTENSEKMRFV